LITVRKDDRFDVDALIQRWDDEQDLADHGVAFLVHGLLDVLVDGHFAAVQSLDAQVEDLQDLLFANAPRHGRSEIPMRPRRLPNGQPCTSWADYAETG
jgi:magnesium transporter